MTTRKHKLEFTVEIESESGVETATEAAEDLYKRIRSDERVEKVRGSRLIIGIDQGGSE